MVCSELATSNVIEILFDLLFKTGHHTVINKRDIQVAMFPVSR